jgi:hypothetical protein
MLETFGSLSLVGRRTRGTRLFVGALGFAALAACSDSGKRTTWPLVGSVGGSAGMGSRSCTVDGVVHAHGESFGPCNQCVCTDGQAMCSLLPCDGGAGGAGGEEAASGAGGVGP